MNISLPTVSDITALLAALEQYPVGSMWLFLLALAGILGMWVFRQKPSVTKRVRDRIKA